MEVYVDDLVIKIKEKKDHIVYLKETLYLLENTT